MKIDIQHISSGEDEVIVRYRDKTPKIKRILDAIGTDDVKIYGKAGDETVSLVLDDILYIETVDDKTFAYTINDVVRLDGSLARLEDELKDERVFRCSKSMMINIDKVERLKALSSNRIDATMINGEHIIISRTYASEFRRILKGGRRER